MEDASDESAAAPVGKKRKRRLHLVNDESLGVARDVYHAARPEKDARAAEMSAVKRLLGPDDLVVADGLNYIKGFRYQLFCEAKALQTPSCVVHVGASAEQCRALHAKRTESEPGLAYNGEVFENLIYRYEEPNGMARWDSPLFTVPHDDEAPPCDAIWEVMFPSQSAASSSLSSAKRGVGVRPNAATVLPQAAESDFLYALDKDTSDVVSTVQRWQTDHVDMVDDGGGEVNVEGADASLILPVGRKLTLAELQRVRRGFVALMRQQGAGAGASRGRLEKGRIKAVFVDYLNDLWEKE